MCLALGQLVSFQQYDSVHQAAMFTEQNGYIFTTDKVGGPYQGKLFGEHPCSSPGDADGQEEGT